jgi:DNA repair protein SbcC/Rad50
VIVREVRLENVKSYGSPAEVIRFQRGVNAISGPNGSGKSTVLEAIGCALFQHLPYPHEKFVREGVPSGTITVVVESSFDQRVYEVVRRIGKGPAQYVFDPDIGQQIARGEADVGRWLRQHLALPEGVDLRSLFLDSVGPPQGTLTAVFLEAGQVRKGKFNRLLQVEEYEDAYRKLSALDGAFDGERKQLDVGAARLETQTAEKPGLLERRDQTRQAQSDGAKQLARLEIQRSALSDVLARLAQAERVWTTATQTHRLAEQQAEFSATQLGRARAEHAAARDAADIWARARAGHDQFVEAERLAQGLEQERSQRDQLIGERTKVERSLTNAVNTAQQLDRDVARAAAAATELTELTQKIPKQVELEQRLEVLRTKRSLVEEAKRRLKQAPEPVELAQQRYARAQAEIRRVDELRPLAIQVSERRQAFQAAADRLAEANRAEGQVRSLRQTIAAERQQPAALESQRAALDREIALAKSLAPMAEKLPDLAKQERSLTEERAAAAGQLQHAAQTRTAVAGGLCPFLHETCRNLRPGVTLETHFDSEIDRWTGEVARIEVMLGTATRELQTAQQAATRQVKLALLREGRTGLTEQLEIIVAKLKSSQGQIEIISRQASGLGDAQRATATAQEALRAAEQAQQEVERLPALKREATAATEILARASGELAALQTQAATEGEIAAELALVTKSLNELGSPRQRAEHVRDEADRLPELQARRRSFDQPIGELHARLDRADAALQPFADLDARVAQVREARTRYRPDYEAFVKASALAGELASRRSALEEAEAQDRAIHESVAVAKRALAAAEAAYDADDHQSRRAEGAAIDTSIGQTTERIQGAALAERELGHRLAEVERAEAELRAIEQAIAQLDLDRQLAGSLRQAIRSAGPEITRQLLGRISRTASRINADILNLSGVELEWTSDYDIVTRRGGEARGFAQLSGGEQMAAALAVRLAILRDLSNARVAFLDEPTAHLDQDRRSNLGDQVQRLQGFDQLVVISHDDTFDGLFGHVIHLGRQEGRTRVLDQQN